MGSEQRRLLGKWLRSCGKGEPDRGLEPEVFRMLTNLLDDKSSDFSGY